MDTEASSICSTLHTQGVGKALLICGSAVSILAPWFSMEASWFIWRSIWIRGLAYR